jgi:hypothetical protein
MPFRTPPVPGPQSKKFRPEAAYNTLPVILTLSPNASGLAGGGTVTMTGQHFRNNPDGSAPVVLVNGVAATDVMVITSTSITFTVPASVTTGVVDVTLTCGSQTVTLVAGFTYYEVVLAALTPAYGPFSGGTRVLLSGYNFTDGATITFDGNAATDVTFIDDQHYSCLTPAHAVGAVDVVLTTTEGTATLPKAFRYTLLTRGEDIRRVPGIVIRDVLNNVPNSCTFTVDGNSQKPYGGEKIGVIDEKDGDRLLFAGTVQTVEEAYEDQTDQVVWNVTAVDFTWLMNKRRPYGAYTLISASEIVKDLVSKYAPGFTSVHVQSGLARVSIVLDGTLDFSTTLNKIASMIGGGHWYVDYDQDVHFFHTVPPLTQLPELPQTEIRSAIAHGRGSAMTVAETTEHYPSVGGGGGGQTLRFFFSTFVYDDGSESGFSDASDPVFLSEGLKWAFSDVPLGTDVGTHACVKRRLYFTANGTSRKFPFAELQDNTTTAFETFGDLHFATADLVTFAGSNAPGTPTVAPPPFGSTAIIAASESTQDNVPPASGAGTVLHGLSGPNSFLQIKITNIYRDMTESAPSEPSNVFTRTDGKAIRLENLPLGPTINDVDVIARKVYVTLRDPNDVRLQGTWGPVDTFNLFIIPDNTSTEYDPVTQVNSIYDSRVPPAIPGVDPVDNEVIWPNPDGPNLEDVDLPDDIDDDNEDLLRDPPFRSSQDLSQVRNKVAVRGVGTTLTEAASQGDTTIDVAETSFFATSQGQVYLGGQIIDYTGVTAVSGPGTLFLQQGLSTDLPEGTAAYLFMEVQDLESQAALAKIELDKDGNPTDGVHEYTVTDSSLASPLQLYMRGMAELEMFAKPLVTITYATRDSKTKAGKKVHVDLTNPPIEGDFLIQEVTIDQVHDESDQITPRYGVKASSTKYELTDLLLRVLGDEGTPLSQGGAGVSSAGLVTKVENTFKTEGFGFQRGGWWQHWSVGALVSNFNFVSVGLPDLTTTGTAAQYLDTSEGENSLYIGVNNNRADRSWLMFETTAVTNNTSGAHSAIETAIEDNFDMQCLIRTPKDQLTDGIYWCGFQTPGSGLWTTKSGINTKLLMIRYSPLDADSGWTAVLQQIGVGHSQYTKPLGVIPQVNTEYLMRIKTQGGPQYANMSVSFQINGGQWTTISFQQTIDLAQSPPYNMPVIDDTNARGLGFIVGVVNRGTTQKRLFWRRASLVAER